MYESYVHVQVTDQPEVYESEPTHLDAGTLNEVDFGDHSDFVDVITVPIKQAFNHFAQREDEIAQFYVQKFGEWKIVSYLDREYFVYIDLFPLLDNRTNYNSIKYILF